MLKIYEFNYVFSRINFQGPVSTLNKFFAHSVFQRYMVCTGKLNLDSLTCHTEFLSNRRVHPYNGDRNSSGRENNYDFHFADKKF